NGISYRGEKTDQILPFLFSWILPIALIVGFWVFMMRRAQKSQGGVFAFGKSKVRIYRENDVKTTFKDVAGVDEAKEELQEIIEYLKSPQKYVHIGAKIPKGVLLVGPPGTGKTLLARAVAGEAKVSFFSISGPEFVEMFVGVGAARVRDLFEQALKSAPCIIFIDELDALGKSRGVNISGGNEEREQTLNQLLVEMDGFETNKGVVIMAATNRPEILDIALLRPGRFDRQVLVDRPDRRGREEILRVHIKGVKLGADVDITKVAQKTPGFVGADLANLVNEAALLAARKNQKEVAMANFDEAVERVIAGLEKKNRIITEKERKIIAYHEVGHALVAESLPNQDKVHKISIVPRGLSALGYTIQLPTEDRYLMTRSELNDKLCVLLGGLSAETITLNEMSTGASNDLARATEIARSMVTQYGMSEELGPVTYKKYGSSFISHEAYALKEYGEAIADKIDSEIRRLIDRARSRAEKILNEKRDQLMKVAGALLEKEYIEGEELTALLNGKPPA
ncbi:MAG: ATP-dependent zinc metalloprotease FtsH, partial [Deltaproteobacteria bacterium]|nr:ATP-dependent zinc metalloprotease FtsH [Deltaproteobacteria bacterium]